MSFMKVSNKNYDDIKALPTLINYCMNDLDCYLEKTQFVYNAVYGLNPLSIEHLIYDFNKLKELYDQNYGKRLHHVVVSIYRKEMSFKGRETSARLLMNSIGTWIFKSGYQCLIFAHVKHSGNIHLHIIMNNIDYRNGKRLHDTKEYFNRLNAFLRCQYGYLQWGKVQYDDFK